MRTKDGFIQGYNAQAAVDATAQVIVAHGLDAKQSDHHQLASIIDTIEANLRQEAGAAVGRRRLLLRRQPCGAGEARRRRLFRAGRVKHAGAGEGGGARIAAMREKIKAGGHAAPIA